MAAGSGLGRQEDQRSPAESPAGLRTTLLSTSHRLPSSPAPQSIAQCLLPAPSHLDRISALSLAMPVPLLFILTPPICDRRLHPHRAGATGRPPGGCRVGVTCAQAGSPSALGWHQERELGVLCSEGPPHPRCCLPVPAHPGPSRHTKPWQGWHDTRWCRHDTRWCRHLLPWFSQRYGLCWAKQSQMVP